MKILKQDQKIFQQLKPNNNVISYIASPSKMGRMAKFDDNTKILVETKGSNWEFINVVQKQVKELGGELIIINTFVDKEQRKITEYKVNW